MTPDDVPRTGSDDERRPSPRDPGREPSRWLKRNDTRVERVVDLFEAHLGVPRRRGRRNALQVLILTVLSQNTNDTNALRAYERLMEAYPPDGDDGDRTGLPRDEAGDIDPVRLRMSQAADAFPSPDWEAVRRSDPDRLEEAISVCGLQSSKAKTIQRVLEWLQEERGDYQLEPLIRDRSSTDAADVLAGVKGIGVKTAAVTLMESREADLCPVDTHVHRICQRLRLVPPTSSRDVTFRKLQPLVPEGKGHSLHHNLLTFGRTICTARDPSCEECFLRRICHYYRNECGGEELPLKFVES